MVVAVAWLLVVVQFLVGGGSVCDDMRGVSTDDEVMLTSPPELAHCAPPPQNCAKYYEGLVGFFANF